MKTLNSGMRELNVKTFLSGQSCGSGTSPSLYPQSGVAELHEDTPHNSGIAELGEGTFLNSVIAEASLTRLCCRSGTSANSVFALVLDNHQYFYQ